MEIDDRITNTELVVSGRGRWYSVMVPRLARKHSVNGEVQQGCPQQGNVESVYSW